MSMLDQHWFSGISRPSRYIGNEINAIRKTRKGIEVSIALAFPDVYEVGMSHLGLKILYQILNSYEWLAAERVFSPWIDLEKELRLHNINLSTLESDLPLTSFDMVGFSLQHELSYTNVLNMLDLSAIPFLAGERADDDPLIIAGGPACFNPEPVAEIFDLMVIGDGEDASVEICRTVRAAKQNNVSDKETILSQLRKIRGVYAPSCFHVDYNQSGTIHDIKPLVSDYSVVKRAILPDIDNFPYPDRQIVPFTELVHDRVAVEISRGCTRGCRFCQAGMIYRPVRERNPKSILEYAEKALKFTGHEDLTLLSLSSGDYSCIEPLLKTLMDRQSCEKTAISLPSLRSDSLNTSLIEQIKRVRKTGFTLASEAGNDRLRRVINKGMTQNDILETAKIVYGAGWNLLKLYFMIGLPFEEEKDLHDIVDLAKQVVSLSGKGGKGKKLNVSVSTFVPKSHTPFMWNPQISWEESQSRIDVVRRGLRGSRVRVKWNQPELSWLEGIFSRGDRRLVRVLIEAWRLGARFDAWGEHFHKEIWEKAFIRKGLDPSFYLHRDRDLDEVLPWDHIKSGVSKKFLKNEWERAKKGMPTPDCREKCLECGVCDHSTVTPLLFNDENIPIEPEKQPEQPAVITAKKYRLNFTKLTHLKHLSHLELYRVFIRAFKRMGLNIVYSQGFHPLPKMSFACALPVGTESMHESMDIEVAEPSGLISMRENMNRQLPSGIEVTSIKALSPRKKKETLKESHFVISVRGGKIEKENLEKFLKSNCFTVAKVSKKGMRNIDARPLVKSMDIITDHKINLILGHTEGPGLKPAEIVRAVFNWKPGDIEIKILKTKQIIS